MNLWCQIIKRNEIIKWIRVYTKWKTNFNSKKRWKEMFFFWNQSINSFIRMSRMNLWCLIIKRKEIIKWILVYTKWKTNFNSKKGGKKSFSSETKASIHLSQWVEWICAAQSLGEWRLLFKFVFIPIEKWTFILKMAQREAFLMKPKHWFNYPKE